MTKTCIAIVALLGVFATDVVAAAPVSGRLVSKTTAAVTKIQTNCTTWCNSGPHAQCYTHCN